MSIDQFDHPAAEACRVLSGLVAAGHRPAALIGDWFGAHAVIVPDFTAVPTDDLFSSDGWYLGWRPYSGRSFGAPATDVLVLTDSGWSAPPPLLPDVSLSPATSPPSPVIRWDDGDRDAHLRIVDDCKEAIRAGEVYQACLSTRFHGAAEPASSTTLLVDAAAWFCERVAHHSPARAAFIPGRDGNGEEIIVASLSPEEFLIRDGSLVRESPIKGTLPDSADPADLLASDKDVAENIMIVDLVRHDLGQIAEIGGVTVTDLLSVHAAPGVWHLQSTVEARIPADLPHAEVIDACFPPASVTGTPKLRATELISRWEPEERGVHCGTIGASFGSRLELNVAIRTAEFRTDLSGSSGAAGFSGSSGAAGRTRVEAGVGGGITIGSDPVAEWDEILAKAAPLRNSPSN